MRTIEPKYRSHSLPPINQPAEPVRQAEYDPLRLCIFTTIAIIAWIVTPPATVAVFAAIGLYGYHKARRAGLLRSRCLLGDTRLVMLYLALAFLAGSSFTIWRFV
jgi:hypothetical protein